MYIIKTDEELRIQKRYLEMELVKVSGTYNELRTLRKDFCALWHTAKDPFIRFEAYGCMKEVDSRIFAVQEIKRSIESDILGISTILNSKPSRTLGYLYDDYHDLNYNDIELYGIHGVKL